MTNRPFYFCLLSLGLVAIVGGLLLHVNETYAATVEIPIFQKMDGLEAKNVDIPTGTDQFEYPDVQQATVEIPYKGNQVMINIDEYEKCVDEQEPGIKTLAESIPGGSSAIPAMRADAMAGCIDFNSGNK